MFAKDYVINDEKEVKELEALVVSRSEHFSERTFH